MVSISPLAVTSQVCLSLMSLTGSLLVRAAHAGQSVFTLLFLAGQCVMLVLLEYRVLQTCAWGLGKPTRKIRPAQSQVFNTYSVKTGSSSE